MTRTLYGLFLCLLGQVFPVWAYNRYNRLLLTFEECLSEVVPQ